MRGMPPTLTVEEAAKLLGIGRRQAYEAVHRGEIPVVRIGRRLIVPTKSLLELIGLTTEEVRVTTAAAQPTLWSA